MVSIDWGTAAATGGASEGWGLVPIYEAATGDEVDLAGSAMDAVGLGGVNDGIANTLGWLQNQGAAAFPGTVDAVDQSVDLSFQTPYVVDQLDQADYYSGQVGGIANNLEQLGYNATHTASQDANTAQGLALNVGQEAHDTSQQAGQTLQGLGMTSYAQGLSDQQQLEDLGQYLGLYGEQLGNFIAGQGNQLGQAQAQAGGDYGLQFQGLTHQALGVDNLYNPGLRDIASQVGATGSQYANQLGGLGTTLQGLGSDLYGRTAPTFDPNQQTAALQQTDQYARSLAGLEATPGPSAAQAQLNLATNQAMQNNLALARSGSGFGESAQAMSQAIAANALAGQDAANQSAMLRAQEDAAWRQRQAANLGAAGQLGLGGAQQFGQQTQFGATLEQTQNEQNANAYLSALAQSGQLTQSAAQTALQGLVQSGQLTQQQADNMFQSLAAGGSLLGQGASVELQGLQGSADTQLQGMGLGLQATQQGQQMGTDAILAGIQAGQSGTQLASDIYAQGAGLQLQGNELGLAAVDQFLAASGHDLAGYQTADQLLNSATGGFALANEQQQAALQAALDQYNQAVANAQNWEQLGISQEQAETDRQRNYMELVGALAQAVGEAIPG